LDFKTAGESHGKGLVGIISNYPSGVPIKNNYIDFQLARRQKGYGRGGRMTIESDKVEIISGIRKGLSTGSPISFIIYNKDWVNWKDIMDPNLFDLPADKEKMLTDPRPGHADLPGFIKYRLKTIRDVIERSSARETGARVCVGSFARAVLDCLNIKIFSFVDRIGNISMGNNLDLKDKDLQVNIEASEVRCPDREVSEKMKAEIDEAKKSGDSIGGSFKIVLSGVIAGLGSFTDWDRRLDARLSYAIMGIPAIKAIEIGQGIKSGTVSGLNFHDEIYYNKENGFYRKTNNAGGIEGGMTNGEDIIIGAVMKPIPTTTKGMKTVNIITKKQSVSIKERSDTCAVPSAAIVGEAVAAIEILNAIQEKFGCDNLEEIKINLDNYKKYLKNL
jgi:chorismate synthase